MKSPAFFRTFSTLQLALGVSVTVHAALISVRFIDPEAFNRTFQDTPLEVILVNARSSEPPEKAQAIAQTHLAGGGEAEKGWAASPLPYTALTAVGDDFEEAQRKVDALQQQQVQLLTQLRKQLAVLPEPDPRKADEGSEQTSEQEKRRQYVKLLAEIEKRIQEENARPKKRYISPATREEVYALYYDTLRRKVEDKGTENFPEQAGRKLYGELTMIVTVNNDGHVLDTEVVEGSGNATLDRRAQAIARAAGPFDAFSAKMRQNADQIAMVARFKFTREQTLETSSVR
ncbi:energy transducer TonB [Verminephrobacter aporrectodeae]|uniref:energy transducer TonB n=1 Tax=Verminephrobacter aporrectodeae TaxID=1110389 RepID=UPI00223814CA|nr:TonB family protein [Verminephrobacter aporrectodeae]MCW5258341.1 TonB family protein [Verminephrobacter aporrectodeae subsp. tuberculatae]MCW8164340.1 TonB family protein [Verminephrobacter aporrectodeae subsp. tuberculatae]MCW8168594.1 TonB family protein [Verminephrobacter aporrectodeae subsp. tuberculatae]MCW8174695.1 TonB family protein [Verminephrobacter aporrectodeae subsp. tuberculatae]MCW8196877.1 TonB family protein [Verminephrobacter aporrectodeae subsp. tuberculatae]